MLKTSRVTHRAYGFYFDFLKHPQNQEVEKESVQMSVAAKLRCKMTAFLVKKVSIRELNSEITTKTTSFAVNYTPLHFFFFEIRHLSKCSLTYIKPLHVRAELSSARCHYRDPPEMFGLVKLPSDVKVTQSLSTCLKLALLMCRLCPTSTVWTRKKKTCEWGAGGELNAAGNTFPPQLMI